MQGAGQQDVEAGLSPLQRAERAYHQAEERKEALLPGAIDAGNWDLHDRLCQEVNAGQWSGAGAQGR